MPIAAALYRLRGLHGKANWAFYRAPLQPACNSTATVAPVSAAAPPAAAVAAAPAATAAGAPCASLFAAAAEAAAAAAKTPFLPAADESPVAAATHASPAAAAAATTSPRQPAAEFVRRHAAGETGRAAVGDVSCCCTSSTGAGREVEAATAARGGTVAAAAAVEGDGEAATSSNTQQQASHAEREDLTGGYIPWSACEQREANEEEEQQKRCSCVAGRGRERHVSSSRCIHENASAAACGRETCAPRQLLVVFLGDISDFFAPPTSSASTSVRDQRRKHQHEQQQQEQWQEEEEEEQRRHEPQQQQQQRPSQQAQRLEQQELNVKEQQQWPPEQQQQCQEGEKEAKEREGEEEGEDEEEAFCCSHYPYSLEGIFWLLSSRFPTHALLLVRPAAVVRHHAVYRHFMPCDACGVPYSIEESVAFFRRHRSTAAAAGTTSSHSLANGSSSSRRSSSGSDNSCRTSSSKDNDSRVGTLRRSGINTSVRSRETREADGECKGETPPPPLAQPQQQSSPLLQSASAAGHAAAAAATTGCSSTEGEEEAVMVPSEQLLPASPRGAKHSTQLSPLLRVQMQQQAIEPAGEEGSGLEEVEKATATAAGSHSSAATSGRHHKSDDCSDPFSAVQHLICLLNSLAQQLQQQQEQQNVQQAVQQQEDHRPSSPQQQWRRPQSSGQQQLHLRRQVDSIEHTVQDHRGHQAQAERQYHQQQPQQQDEKEAQHKGQGRLERCPLRGEKQQRAHERSGGAHTACDTFAGSSVFAAASSASEATPGAYCCCEVTLDDFWQATFITLLGFSKGAAVVLSCLRSTCRCWRDAAARRSSFSARSPSGRYASPQTHAAAAAAIPAHAWKSASFSSSAVRPVHADGRSDITPTAAAAAKKAMKSLNACNTSSSRSSTEAPPSPPLAATTAGVPWCTGAAAVSVAAEGATGAAAATPAAGTSASSSRFSAPAAGPLPKTCDAADVRDDCCCFGKNAALCPALSSFWRRVQVLHIVDGGLSVPHVLFEISSSQLVARFRVIPPAAESSRVTAASLMQESLFSGHQATVVSDTATPRPFSVVTSATKKQQQLQKQRRHNQLQTPTCCCSCGQAVGPACCCRTVFRDASSSSSKVSSSSTTATNRSSIQNTTRYINANSSFSSSSTHKTSSTTGNNSSSSSSVTNISGTRTQSGGALLPEDSEVDAEREDCLLEAWAEEHGMQVMREGGEEERQWRCSVHGDNEEAKGNDEERAFHVLQQNAEKQHSEAEQQHGDGLKQIWVHCSSRQLFDGRRPFIREETMGFLRAVLRAAAICDAPTKEGAIAAVDNITGCAKGYVRHSKTALNTVGFVRYYMPRFQRRALCLHWDGDSSVAVACETPENILREESRLINKEVQSLSCCSKEVGAGAQVVGGTHSDAHMHNTAADHVDSKAHTSAATATAPTAVGALAEAPAKFGHCVNCYQQEKEEARREVEAEIFSCRVAVDPNFGLDAHFNLLSDATLALQLSSAGRHGTATAALVSPATGAHKDVNREDKGGSEEAVAGCATTTLGDASTEKHSVSAESNVLDQGAAHCESSPKRRTPISPFGGPVGQRGSADGTGALARETEMSERYTKLYDVELLRKVQCFDNNRLLEVDVPVPQSIFFEEWRELSGTRFF